MKKTKFVEKTFTHPIPAVDVVIFSIKEKSLQLLLIKMIKKPYLGHWALPGGLVRTEESVDEAAQRSLLTKTGLRDIYLEQLYTFGQPDRDPLGRVVSIAYFALIPDTDIELISDARYGGVEWHSVDDLPPLAYDHKHIVKVAIDRLRAKLAYTNIIRQLLNREFTMSELQEAYEVILGEKLDKRNFQKKIHALGLVKKTGTQKKQGPSRPAALYKFKNPDLETVQIL